MTDKQNKDTSGKIGRAEPPLLCERRSWPGPRTVVVPKVDDSFDFSLRHLVVQPPQKTSSVDSSLKSDEFDIVDPSQPYSVEKHASGGTSSQPMETIFVKQVKENSKAHNAGLRTGDRIVSINGVNVAGKTYSQVIRLIHGSDSALTLMVIPKDEDVLQMAYTMTAGDDGDKETMSGRNTSVLSTCRVSLSPTSSRRTEECFNHNSATASSQFGSLQGHNPTEEASSTNPSLHIHVRINASGQQGRSSVGYEPVQPRTVSSREPTGEHWISGGSSFYPVTTTARKVKPEGNMLPDETQRHGPVTQSERYNRLKASEVWQSPRNFAASESDNYGSPVLQKGQQCSAFTCSLTPLQPTDATDLQGQSPKMTSYQEITLSKFGERGANALSSSAQLVVPRASSQESSCSSSHFIQIGTTSHSLRDAGNPTSIALNPASPPRTSSSMVGVRQQMFVSARPQSYESLFGQSKLEQVPAASAALSVTPSKSSNELMDAETVHLRQPSMPNSRLSAPAEQPRISLVTERMKKFQSIDTGDGAHTVKPLKHWEDEAGAKGGCPQFGYDSVAKRAAQFEQVSSEDVRRHADTPSAQGRRNAFDTLKTYTAGLTGEHSRDLWANTSPSANSKQVPQTVTIPLYFRADPSLPNARLTSPTFKYHENSSSNFASDGIGTESGVHTSVSSETGSLDKNTRAHSSEIQTSGKVTSRQLSSHQEKAASEKATDGSCSMTVESISQSTTLAMAATLGIKDQLFAGESFESPSSPVVLSTHPKSANSNIKKFVAFFTDKAQKTFDPVADKKCTAELLASSGNVSYEGYLVCKAAVAEGKKASDRSWKPFWAALKGHFLCLYKDRLSTTSEEQSICIKSCLVEVAVDYLKKRNVFQVTTASGSKFLFQADDAESMSHWVRAIEENSEMKETQGTTTTTTTAAATTTLGQNLQRGLPAEKTSPQIVPKAKKQSTRIIPPSKSPASPLSKSRKPGMSDKSPYEVFESPRGKEHKTWKGKMVKKFGRRRSGSNTTVEITDDQELTGTFGVPLYACFPSLFNECVPLIVETCTRIVEERGLENQGIYRVPGNSCAVNALRDELNKFPDNIDPESDKWQDVNVVSSLLKLFFRKLPDSLITDDLYEPVITAYQLQNPEKKMLKLKKLLHGLPEHNFETFRFLAQHLNRVAGREEINKMDARNLAIVFGPTLVRPQDDSIGLMVKDMSDQCRVVETIIVNVDWFFSSWDEDVNVPLAEENEPISSMNTELLAKAENLMNPNEMTRDLSAKDLMTSIFHAANKKIRRKDKNKSADSIETEGESDVSCSDRNIDQDLDILGMKELLEASGSRVGVMASASVGSSPATTSSVGFSSCISMGVVESQQQMAKASAEAVAEAGAKHIGSAVGVKKYPAYHFGPVSPAAETENSKPKILRRYSEDAFGLSASGEHDELMLRPVMHDGSLVQHAEQQLRRLHLDARALHHKQELERIEREKRNVDKERVEREFNKTLQELELGDGDLDELSKFSTSLEANAVSSGESSSVRSAMNRCKLAMYENRLRFFTDFGEKKALSPAFCQGPLVQSGSSSDVSLSPLTRRLSDQPGHGSLRRTEDGLLATAPPARSHSVSPSIIGREPRYNFDITDKNSELTGITREPSSVRKFDQSLAMVSENQLGSDFSVFLPQTTGQSMTASSPTDSSVKGLSISSASSLTVSFGTESSITRSSVTSGESSADQSAKDSVFSEKSPTETEPTLPYSANIAQNASTASILDGNVLCKVMKKVEDSPDCIPEHQQSDEPLGSSIQRSAKITANVSEICCDIEKFTLNANNEHCRTVNSQGGEGTKTSELSDLLESQKNESLPLTVVCGESGLEFSGLVLDSQMESLKSSDAYKNTTVKVVDTVALAEQDAISAEFSASEKEPGLIVKDFYLVNLHGSATVDNPNTELGEIAHSRTVAVAAFDDYKTPSNLSAKLDLVSLSTMDGILTDDQKVHLSPVDVTGVTDAGDLEFSHSSYASSLPLQLANGHKDQKESGTDLVNASNTEFKTYDDILLNGCTPNFSDVVHSEDINKLSNTDSELVLPSVNTSSETVTKSSSLQSKSLTISFGLQTADTVTQSTNSIAMNQTDIAQNMYVGQSRDVLVATLILPTGAACQYRAPVLSLSDPSSAFSRTFSQLDDCNRRKVKQRHSICGSCVPDLLPEDSQFSAFDVRHFESRNLAKVYRVASLPILP